MRLIQYQEYLKTGHWKKLRFEALRSTFGRCTFCKAQEGIEVHHLVYRNLLDCSSRDLMPLCRICHGTVHSSEAMRALYRSSTDADYLRRMTLAFLNPTNKDCREAQRANDAFNQRKKYKAFTKPAPLTLKQANHRNHQEERRKRKLERKEKQARLKAMRDNPP